MDINTFLKLLIIWSTLTSLIVEVIKLTFGIKAKNIVAFCTAIVVGLAGNLLVYYFTGVTITDKEVTTAVLMGLASGITSQVGYDKVKQAIEQIGVIR